MSRFYGTVQGNRGEASRGGSKESGMVTWCASWEGAIYCCAYYDEETKRDVVLVKKAKWHGAGEERVLYRGPIGEEREQ